MRAHDGSPEAERRELRSSREGRPRIPPAVGARHVEVARALRPPAGYVLESIMRDCADVICLAAWLRGEVLLLTRTEAAAHTVRDLRCGESGGTRRHAAAARRTGRRARSAHTAAPPPATPLQTEPDPRPERTTSVRGSAFLVCKDSRGGTDLGDVLDSTVQTLTNSNAGVKTPFPPRGFRMDGP